VRRYTDEAAGAEQDARIGDGEGFGRQMNPVGARGDRDVDAIVDEESSAMAITDDASLRSVMR